MPNTFVPFRDNNLGREGAAALAPALQAMLGLTSLDLRLVYFLHANNNIGTDAKHVCAIQVQQSRLRGSSGTCSGSASHDRADVAGFGVSVFSACENNIGTDAKHVCAIQEQQARPRGSSGTCSGSASHARADVAAFGVGVHSLHAKTTSALMPNTFVPSRDNNLGSEGAAALAPALQAMPGLTLLDLGLVHFLHVKTTSALMPNTFVPHSGATIWP
jgi:hypothetical protein